MKSYNGLLAIAEERKTTGQIDIGDFVFKQNEKILRELVTKFSQM